MNPSLTVKEYFFPFVQVAADAEFDSSNGVPEIAFETKVVVEKAPDNDTYQVMLEITAFPENEQKKIPYSIHLVAVGLFSVSKEWEDPEKLLKINGASILYSSAREFIITITSRGPWPPVLLPTVSFIPAVEEKKSPVKRKRVKKEDKVSVSVDSHGK
jgi:preprotein translocase subunit SecB